MTLCNSEGRVVLRQWLSGSISGFPAPHVVVSLGKTLNPQRVPCERDEYEEKALCRL